MCIRDSSTTRYEVRAKHLRNLANTRHLGNTSTEFSIFGFCLGEINGYLYTDGSDYNRAVNYYKAHVQDSSMKINVINKTNSNAIVGSLIIDLTNTAFKIAVSGVSVGNSTVIF